MRCSCPAAQGWGAAAHHDVLPATWQWMASASQPGGDTEPPRQPSHADCLNDPGTGLYTAQKPAGSNWQIGLAEERAGKST